VLRVVLHVSEEPSTRQQGAGWQGSSGLAALLACVCGLCGGGGAAGLHVQKVRVWFRQQMPECVLRAE
jgi:hypothetical protein